MADKKVSSIDNGDKTRKSSLRYTANTIKITPFCADLRAQDSQPSRASPIKGAKVDEDEDENFEEGIHDGEGDLQEEGEEDREEQPSADPIDQEYAEEEGAEEEPEHAEEESIPGEG